MFYTDFCYITERQTNLNSTHAKSTQRNGKKEMQQSSKKKHFVLIISIFQFFKGFGKSLKKH